MERRKIIQVVEKVSDGLFETITDVLLLSTYISLTHMTVRNAYQSYQAGKTAYRLLDEINYKTIKRSVYNMVAKGFLRHVSKKGREELAITAFGRKRIEAVIPLYRINRPWDGHLYLISYDIPTRANDERNLLREYIRKTGGALLQESLWINPYNPTNILSDFVAQHDIRGSILVSKIGKDGVIGDEKLTDLLKKVYHLDDLALRYTSFLTAHKKRGRQEIHPIETVMSYLSILKTDPQLPFPLEPEDFPAARAYQLYLQLTKKS